jgi:hypothetical protein
MPQPDSVHPPLAGNGRVRVWFDLLENLIHQEPVTVRGASHAGGDVWSSSREAKQLGVALEQVDSMQVIGLFSSAASRSMMEILGLLRQRASASLPEAA